MAWRGVCGAVNCGGSQEKKGGAQAKRVADNVEPLADLTLEAAQQQAKALALGTQAAADKISEDIKARKPILRSLCNYIIMGVCICWCCFCLQQPIDKLVNSVLTRS